MVETANGTRVRMNQMRFRGGHKSFSEILKPNSTVSIHVSGILALGPPSVGHKWWPRIEKPEPGEYTLKAFASPIYLIDADGNRLGKHLSLSSGTVDVHFDKATVQENNVTNDPE